MFKPLCPSCAGSELNIVTWTPDPPSFVARALSPADVVRVVVDEDEHAMEVVVADDQLSLAIGRQGQNVKLASKLSGWRIDVRSESVAEEETKRVRDALSAIPGVGIGESELLFQEGYRSVQEVASASVEELAEIEGFDEERLEVILAGAREFMASVEAPSEDDELMVDIDQLVLPGDLARGASQAQH